MDFGFTPEEWAWRDEVVAFLEQETPPEWAGSPRALEDSLASEERYRFHKQTAAKLGAKGWLALSWPKEYGGLGRSRTDSNILRYETTLRRLPGIDPFGTGTLGPTLIALGDDGQKRRHLGAIAKGEVIWCEGFSEPGAGSDLASVRTAAVQHGDFFVLSGQKVWTTGAHFADWCFALARTDPPLFQRIVP